MWQDKKNRLIQSIFDKLWDQEEQTLTRAVVTIADIEEAIHEFNESPISSVLGPMSLDIAGSVFTEYAAMRSYANERWPKSIFRRGYAARFDEEASSSFRFVQIAEGQTKPFPE